MAQPLMRTVLSLEPVRGPLYVKQENIQEFNDLGTVIKQENLPQQHLHYLLLVSLVKVCVCLYVYKVFILGILTVQPILMTHYIQYHKTAKGELIQRRKLCTKLWQMRKIWISNVSRAAEQYFSDDQKTS